MKTTTLVLILFLTSLNLPAQTPPAPTTQPRARLMQMRLQPATNNPAGSPAGLPAIPASPASSSPLTGAPVPVAPATAPATGSPPTAPAFSSGSATTPEKEVPGYSYNFPGVDVNQVLDVYADLVGRTLLRAGLPQASIVLKTQSPLTRTEAIQALQAVLALNGIAVVNIGEKFVKVLPPEQANAAGAAFNNLEANQLPELGSYVTHIVQLKYVRPALMLPIIQPFAKLPSSISAIDDNGILVIRDYAENVKRMLEMIEKIDVSVPAVYISEVIPIKYAQADDIANALNSLGGGGGGATVSIGSSGSTTPISGIAGNRTGTGVGGLGGTTQSGAYPGASPFGQSRPATGTPSTATPFQQRLLNIVNQAGGAGGKEQIQIFGQAKIIADERANALLVFATRPDMEMIKHVISQLDVLLSQVLIEAVIVDYELGPNTFSLGVSAAQNPKSFSPGVPVVGAGGYNNGQTFLNLMTNSFSSGSNVFSSFASSLGSGFSYFGNIGPTWNLAMTAIAGDSHANVIQRPRIQTSQAKPAQFFVGETVPYITSYGNYGYGNQSSYSQLSVGVELDVTPFINPDGLVVMQVQQEIDDIIPNGSVNINGTPVPSTTKRTLNSEIAVKDKDTVMLGGFIKNSKSTGKTGVPFLQDIPLLGSLFSQRNDSKSRTELIVLMRPTVLKTPEIAAANTITEGRRLSGVSSAIAEEVEEQGKLVDAERKIELKHPKTMAGGFFNTAMPTNAPAQQFPQPQAQGGGFFTPVTPYKPAIPVATNNAAPPRF